MNIRISHLNSLNRCEEVFTLYRGESGTLGFMPKGAFQEGILNKRLLVALDDMDRIVGYILYRVVGRRASIAHLCIARYAREKGVAAKLVSALKEHTEELDGITLKCRNDYDAHRIWPRLGFVAKGTTTGRGRSRAELTVWHIDHGHPDLFSVEPTKTRAVIDANVFYDLWDHNRPTSEVSASIVEPWVDEIIELVLTPEIYNDIQRSGITEIRDKSRALVTAFEQIRASSLEVDRIVSLLRTLYPASVLLNPRDESDIRHLAFTIAAGVRYFVTRDEGLLDKSSEVLQRFDVQVLSPTELVSQLDWILRERAYQPLRLEGSSITSQRADARMLDALVSVFRECPEERIFDFRKGLERCFADPKGQEVRISLSKDGSVLALIALNTSQKDEMDLTFVRLTKQELAPTVLRHMLMSLVREAVKNNNQTIRAKDIGSLPDVTSALQEVGFRLISGYWVKPIFSDFISRAEIDIQLGVLNIDNAVLANQHTDEIESFIWPAKLNDEEIPCYLIPIRAEWAEHFFDTELAEQRFPSMSGLREELHLGVEAAYYSASNVVLKAPGRILWYVSQGNEKMGSMQVKACSRLREVVRDRPKVLFKRFRRLGVYVWDDLYQLAHQCIEKELSALRFSHTERFQYPLGAKALSIIGVPPPYPGPRPISHAAFVSIYHQATTMHHE